MVDIFAVLSVYLYKITLWKFLSFCIFLEKTEQKRAGPFEF